MVCEGNTMNISADKYIPEGEQPVSFPALLQTIRNLLWRLTHLFVLTEEERSKAGIYLGGEGRD
jgi:hypothetical protein